MKAFRRNLKADKFDFKVAKNKIDNINPQLNQINLAQCNSVMRICCIIPYL